MKKKEVDLLKWLNSLVIFVILKLKAHQFLTKPAIMIDKKKKYSTLFIKLLKLVNFIKKAEFICLYGLPMQSI